MHVSGYGWYSLTDFYSFVFIIMEIHINYITFKLNGNLIDISISKT